MQKLSKLLLSAPGLFGQTARLIDNALPCSDAALAIPATLALFSTLKCGRIVSKTGIHPNIYTCVIADSGRGKTQVQKIIADILNECGLFKLRCGVPTSDSGLCKRLNEFNRQLLIWDEFGSELESLALSKSGYERRILKCMMELYSMAGKDFIGKQYATQDRIDVKEPFLNTFAGTTSIRFFGALNEKFMHDGFLSRWILFFPEGPTDRRGANPFVLPRQIKDYIRQLEDWLPSDRGDLATVLSKGLVELRFENKETAQLHRDVQRDFTRRLDKAPNDSIERVFWARALENYVKVVIAVAEAEIVGYDSVLWACDLIEQCIGVTLDKCEESVRPSDREAVKEKFYNSIALGATVTKSQLTKKTWRLNLTARERSELIDTLCEAELWQTRQETDLHTSRKTVLICRIK